MVWQVTFTEYSTEEQFVWNGTATDEANAKKKAKGYFRTRLSGLTEDTGSGGDYLCVAEALESSPAE